MSGTERQRRHRDRVRLGMHVTRPLAVPDADLVFKLIELGYPHRCRCGRPGEDRRGVGSVGHENGDARHELRVSAALPNAP